LEIWIVSLREVEHLLDEKHGDDLVIREREITSSPSFYFPYTLTPHFIFETPPYNLEKIPSFCYT